MTHAAASCRMSRAATHNSFTASGAAGSPRAYFSSWVCEAGDPGAVRVEGWEICPASRHGTRTAAGITAARKRRRMSRMNELCADESMSDGR